MSQTLAEYAKLEIDPMISGVFDEILTTNALMGFLQYQPFEGNAMKYNRELTLPASATHQVGDTWSNTHGTKVQKTAELAIVGVQTSVDRYARDSRSSQNSQKAVAISDMAKSLARKIEQLIITGEPEATSTEFEGIDSLVRADTRMMAMDDGVLDGPGTVETELTLDRLDEMLDLSEGGEFHAIMCNKTMRRKLTALSRVTGSGIIMTNIEMFGHKITVYDGKPIIVNDFITNAETYNDGSTWPSSTATTIFGLKFGKEAQGLTIIHNGPVLQPDIQDLGTSAVKNEDEHRMAVYIQQVGWSSLMYAAIGGIDSTA